MTLLPLIEETDNAAQAQFLSQVPPLNLFKALAHAPGLATVAATMGGVILYQSKLDPKLRELAILRAAHLAGSTYEVGHHERIGRDVGLTDAQIAAVRNGGDSEILDDAGQLVVAWAEDFVRAGHASAAHVGEAIDMFGHEQTVELAVTIGYYLMIASFLTTFAVPFEGGDFDQGVKISQR